MKLGTTILNGSAAPGGGVNLWAKLPVTGRPALCMHGHDCDPGSRET